MIPQNSATNILDNAAFAITIKPVCVIVIAIQDCANTKGEFCW
jgi:hypothetical protein